MKELAKELIDHYNNKWIEITEREYEVRDNEEYNYTYAFDLDNGVWKYYKLIKPMK